VIINVKEILKYLEDSNLKFTYIGNSNINISRYSSINNIKENSVSWIKNKNYYNELVISKSK